MTAKKSKVALNDESINIADKLNEISKKDEYAQIFKGQLGLSNIYLYNNNDDVKIIDDEKGTGYFYNSGKGIWELREDNFFINHLANYLSSYLADVIKSLDDESGDIKKIKKILDKIRTYSFAKSIFNFAKPSLLDKTVKFNYMPHLVSFKNGVYDLKENKFKMHSKEYMISKFLPFEYNKEVNEKIEKEILTIIKNISNDNELMFNFNLNWFGYCLTGEIMEQKFLIIEGNKASNGKSTLLSMFEKVFDIYTHKVPNNTFKVNNPKLHKILDHLRFNPVRLIYIEELDQERLDTSLIKEFAGGTHINNEVMYGNTENITIQAKLSIATNNCAVFKADEGMRRRGLLSCLTNKFIDIEEYNKMKQKHRLGHYVRNKNLLEKFNTLEYKQQFANIIIDRAVKYYEKGLSIYSVLTENFKDLSNENDSMQTFIDKYFEVTNDKDDIINKDYFLTLWNTEHKTKIGWSTLLTDVKRKLTYDKDKKSKCIRGCIVGIKDKPRENANLMEDDEETD